jgi:CDP-diglyceride synthetase
MGSSTPWIMMAIVAALIIVLAIVAMAVMIRKKKQSAPDYYSFFWMGIIWMAFGAVFMIGRSDEFNALFAIGLIFAILGMANKDKWKKNRRNWKTLSKEDRKIRTIIMIALGVLVLLGLAAMLLVKTGYLR